MLSTFFTQFLRISIEPSFNDFSTDYFMMKLEANFLHSNIQTHVMVKKSIFLLEFLEVLAICCALDKQLFPCKQNEEQKVSRNRFQHSIYLPLPSILSICLGKKLWISIQINKISCLSRMRFFTLVGGRKKTFIFSPCDS